MKKLFTSFICALVTVLSYANIYELGSNGYLEYFPMSNGEITITGGSIYGDVTIPDKIEERFVTALSSGAFIHQIGLKSITLPDKITTIADRAFMDCQDLKSVVAPSVKNVNQSAFNNCLGLETVTFAKELNIVTSYAFFNCCNLKQKFIIVNGGKNDRVGSHAFYHSGITALELHGVNPYEYSFAHCPDLKTVTFDGVNTIYAYAFEDTPIKDVNLDKVKIIWEFAFAHCVSLQNVTLNMDVADLNIGTWSIMENAFVGCNNLSRTVINSEQKINIEPGAFTGCTGTLHINFPTGRGYLSKNGHQSPYEGAMFTEAWLDERCTNPSMNLFYEMPELTRVVINTDLETKMPLNNICPRFDGYIILGNNISSGLKVQNGILVRDYTDKDNSAGVELVDIPYGQNIIKLPKNTLRMPATIFKNHEAIIDATALTKVPEVSSLAYVYNKMYVAPGMKKKFIEYAQTHCKSDVERSAHMYLTCEIEEVHTGSSADVNGDGNINSTDVVAVYNQIIAGK